MKIAKNKYAEGYFKVLEDQVDSLLKEAKTKGLDIKYSEYDDTSFNLIGTMDHLDYLSKLGKSHDKEFRWFKCERDSDLIPDDKTLLVIITKTDGRQIVYVSKKVWERLQESGVDELKHLRKTKESGTEVTVEFNTQEIDPSKVFALIESAKKKKNSKSIQSKGIWVVCYSSKNYEASVIATCKTQKKAMEIAQEVIESELDAKYSKKLEVEEIFSLQDWEDEFGEKLESSEIPANNKGLLLDFGT